MLHRAWKTFEIKQTALKFCLPKWLESTFQFSSSNLLTRPLAFVWHKSIKNDDNTPVPIKWSKRNYYARDPLFWITLCWHLTQLEAVYFPECSSLQNKKQHRLKIRYINKQTNTYVCISAPLIGHILFLCIKLELACNEGTCRRIPLKRDSLH